MDAVNKPRTGLTARQRRKRNQPAAALSSAQPGTSSGHSNGSKGPGQGRRTQNKNRNKVPVGGGSGSEINQVLVSTGDTLVMSEIASTDKLAITVTTDKQVIDVETDKCAIEVETAKPAIQPESKIDVNSDKRALDVETTDVPAIEVTIAKPAIEVTIAKPPIQPELPKIDVKSNEQTVEPDLSKIDIKTDKWAIDVESTKLAIHPELPKIDIRKAHQETEMLKNEGVEIDEPTVQVKLTKDDGNKPRTSLSAGQSKKRKLSAAALSPAQPGTSSGHSDGSKGPGQGRRTQNKNRNTVPVGGGSGSEVQSRSKINQVLVSTDDTLVMSEIASTDKLAIAVTTDKQVIDVETDKCAVKVETAKPAIQPESKIDVNSDKRALDIETTDVPAIEVTIAKPPIQPELPKIDVKSNDQTVEPDLSKIDIKTDKWAINVEATKLALRPELPKIDIRNAHQETKLLKNKGVEIDKQRVQVKLTMIDFVKQSVGNTESSPVEIVDTGTVALQQELTRIKIKEIEHPVTVGDGVDHSKMLQVRPVMMENAVGTSKPLLSQVDLSENKVGVNELPLPINVPDDKPSVMTVDKKVAVCNDGNSKQGPNKKNKKKKRKSQRHDDASSNPAENDVSLKSAAELDQSKSGDMLTNKTATGEKPSACSDLLMAKCKPTETKSHSVNSCADEKPMNGTTDVPVIAQSSGSTVQAVANADCAIVVPASVENVERSVPEESVTQAGKQNRNIQQKVEYKKSPRLSAVKETVYVVFSDDTPCVVLEDLKNPPKSSVPIEVNVPPKMDVNKKAAITILKRVVPPVTEQGASAGLTQDLTQGICKPLHMSVKIMPPLEEAVVEDIAEPSPGAGNYLTKNLSQDSAESKIPPQAVIEGTKVTAEDSSDFLQDSSVPILLSSTIPPPDVEVAIKQAAESGACKDELEDLTTSQEPASVVEVAIKQVPETGACEDKREDSTTPQQYTFTMPPPAAEGVTWESFRPKVNRGFELDEDSLKAIASFLQEKCPANYRPGSVGTEIEACLHALSDYPNLSESTRNYFTRTAVRIYLLITTDLSFSDRYIGYKDWLNGVERLTSTPTSGQTSRSSYMKRHNNVPHNSHGNNSYNRDRHHRQNGNPNVECALSPHPLLNYAGLPGPRYFSQRPMGRGVHVPLQGNCAPVGARMFAHDIHYNRNRKGNTGSNFSRGADRNLGRNSYDKADHASEHQNKNNSDSYRYGPRSKPAGLNKHGAAGEQVSSRNGARIADGNMPFKNMGGGDGSQETAAGKNAAVEHSASGNAPDGNATGGNTAGGNAAGGDTAIGNAAGGDAAIGNAAGGDAAIGNAAGGDAAGENAAGGDAAGGKAAGGDAASGNAAGGDAAGGTAAGGDAAGGTAAGGDAGDGTAAGGDAGGGTAAGGDAAGGNAAGGDAGGGTAAGGDAAGGNAAGGDAANGNAAGGDTAGGTAAGGDAAGENAAGGDAAGGNAAGGDATGGNAPDGNAVGGPASDDNAAGVHALYKNPARCVSSGENAVVGVVNDKE